MKLSQLIKVIPSNDEIIVCEEFSPIDKMRVYAGYVKGITKENPINKAEVNLLLSDEGRFIVEISSDYRKLK